MSAQSMGIVAVVAVLAAGGSARADDRLPDDFARSAAVWGGIGGAKNRQACGALDRLPVVLVHGDGQGPEVWFDGEGRALTSSLSAAGFGPCELWAVRLGQTGEPLRSLEELTDDVRFFVVDVLAYTRAPRVQIVAMGEAAVLVHGTLAKYRVHHLVDSVVYVQAPFGGVSGCTAGAAVAGKVLCGALSPGSSFLRRALMPVQAPHALVSVTDAGRRGHLRYLTLGRRSPDDPWQRTTGPGGWALDNAWNLTLPGDGSRDRFVSLDELGRGEAKELLLRFLDRPARLCADDNDADGDGFCARAAGGNDCDDNDPEVHPRAREVEADGKDQDCNAHDLDRSFPGWKCERPLPSAKVDTAQPTAGPVPTKKPEPKTTPTSAPAVGPRPDTEQAPKPVPDPQPPQQADTDMSLMVAESTEDARWMGWAGAVLMVLGALLMLVGKKLTGNN